MSGGDDFYTIGQLWFSVLHASSTGPEYRKAAQARGISVVQFNDKNNINGFFLGKKSFQEIADQVSGEAVESLTSSKPVKYVSEEQKQVGGEKKRDIKMHEKSRRLIDTILENELKIASRFTAIQVKDRSFLKVLQLGYAMVGKKAEAERV